MHPIRILKIRKYLLIPEKTPLKRGANMYEMNDIKVSDAMNKKPVSVKPGIRVSECAKIMREQDIGSLLVEDNGLLLGFITEQGIVHKIVARGKDPNDVCVEDIMLRNVLTVSPQMELYKAMKMMTRREIRQLPVIDEGKIVGLITRNDVLQIQPTLIDILAEKFRLQREYNRY